VIDEEMEKKLKEIFKEYNWYEDIIVTYDPDDKEYEVTLYYKYTRLFKQVIDETLRILERELGGKTLEYEIGCVDNGKFAIDVFVKKPTSRSDIHSCD